jgi:hypothetical protein
VYNLDEQRNGSRPRPAVPHAAGAGSGSPGGARPSQRRRGSAAEASDDVPFLGFLIFYYPFAYLWYLFFMALGVWALTGVLAWDILIPPLAFAVSSLIRGGVRAYEARRLKKRPGEPVGRQRPAVLFLTLLGAISFGGLGGYLLSQTAAGQSASLSPLALTVIAAIWESLQALRRMPE